MSSPLNLIDYTDLAQQLEKVREQVESLNRAEHGKFINLETVSSLERVAKAAKQLSTTISVKLCKLLENSKDTVYRNNQ